MDSKDVSKAIKAVIWPALQEIGFARASTRTAWREHPDRVDVINLGSMGSPAAAKGNVTTFSFSVFAGCYFRYIPGGDERVVERRTGAVNPEPSSCHARIFLKRGYFDFMEAPTLWRIDAQGRKLPKAIDDARRVIVGDGQRWLGQFSTPRAVYDMLASNRKFDQETFLYGTAGSPAHRYLLGYTALAAGLREQACTQLLGAADSGSFKFDEERLRRDAARAVEESAG
jgi:hypothetical protein